LTRDQQDSSRAGCLEDPSRCRWEQAIGAMFRDWQNQTRLRYGRMQNPDDDYVYDEATGEWRPASELAAEIAARNAVRDCAGNVLADGDAVVLVKDLKVKGAGQTLKQGTVIRSIRLTDNPEEIDCRHNSIKGLVLRTEFVRKR